MDLIYHSSLVKTAVNQMFDLLNGVGIGYYFGGAA